MRTIAADVARYYGEKLAAHGTTPRGVDWNDDASQALRFDRLLAADDTPEDRPLVVNDLGCGYGALLDHLRRRWPGRSVDYSGTDVSPAMVEAARERHADASGASFAVSSAPVRPADVTVASGIFNVRMGWSDNEWHAYTLRTIDAMVASSRRACAFNCLTSYADADRRRPDLYYADPTALFDYCKRRHSRYVTLMHDYPLYEFTIVVRFNGEPRGSGRSA